MWWIFSNFADMKQNVSSLTSNEAFVLQHREDDVRRLALKKMPEDIDVLWCLQQIEGWQLARKKLPRWAMVERLHYPPRISMEQCSSEHTALYKRNLVARLLGKRVVARGKELAGGEEDAIVQDASSMIDLTGGFGIDFSYLAPLFHRAVYVERQSHLCDIARHNFRCLGLTHIEVVNEEFGLDSSLFFSNPSSGADLSQPFVSGFPQPSMFSLIYLDPARRDSSGRKVVALEDCTPNVVELQGLLRAHSRYIVVKLSPMLDITLALRQLQSVTEVHVVSVQGECKELLLVIDSVAEQATIPTYYCANIKVSLRPSDLFSMSEDDEATECFVFSHRTFKGTVPSIPVIDPSVLFRLPSFGEGSNDAFYLYEPNASVLKAGVQDALPAYYPVQKIQMQSNLFVSKKVLPDFPGRKFRIVSVGDFSKKSLKEQLRDLKQANLTIRNFPGKVDLLRKQLKISEGGENYLFATTLADGHHALIHCRQI